MTVFDQLQAKFDARGVQRFAVDVVPGARPEEVAAEMLRCIEGLERGEFTIVADVGE
jgi:hypothetical protein